MRNTPLFKTALSLLLGSFFIVLFTSYGNTKVHPSINEMIVESFLGNQSNPKTTLPEFKHYYFNLDLVKQCKGTAVTKSGFFKTDDILWINKDYVNKIQDSEGNLIDLATLKATIDEGAEEHSAIEWIAHGGYSADEPELPASLRHFYDPTVPEGKRYLTDVTNAKLMGLLQRILKNPERDGVEWALGKPGDLAFGKDEHSYTWEKGKAWMRMALEEKNEDKRSEYMGLAWRSLGETLHMIADNGCPPHVRNDAHPSPLVNYNLIFGNPDPYEEIVDIVRNQWPDDFLQYFKGKPDKMLVDQMGGMKRAVEIAHAIAVYTNSHFVTNETISGTDKKGKTWQQITHPEHQYSSPTLQQMDYEASTGFFTTRIKGYDESIKQCNDKMYWVELIPELAYSYVTFDCVESQAKVLLPNVVQAGRKVMELFIPKIKIEIKSAENGRVKGQIIHTKDAEYTKEIRYSGKATLYFKDKNFHKKAEKEIVVKDGNFDANGLSFENGDHVYARIDCGGIGIESGDFKCGGKAQPEVKAKDEPKYRRVTVNVYGYGKWSNHVKWNNVDWGATDWVGLKAEDMRIPVEGPIKYQARVWGHDNVVMDAEVTSDKVVRLHITSNSKADNIYADNWDIVIENLPMTEPGMYKATTGNLASTGGVSHGGGTYSLGKNPGQYIKKATCERVFPDGQRIRLVNIDWDRSEGSDAFSPRAFVKVSIY